MLPLDIMPYFDLNDAETIQSIHSVWNHSAALTSNGRLFVWERNNHGQVGNSTTEDASIPVDITNYLKLSPGEQIKQVELGWGHSMVLTSAGSAF